MLVLMKSFNMYKRGAVIEMNKSVLVAIFFFSFLVFLSAPRCQSIEGVDLQHTKGRRT